MSRYQFLRASESKYEYDLYQVRELIATRNISSLKTPYCMWNASQVMPDDNENQNDAANRGNCVCACPRRPITILIIVGALLIVVVVTVGSIFIANPPSPPSPNPSGGPAAAITGSNQPNMSAPLTVPVAVSPTDAPTHLPSSPSIKPTPPSASVVTLAPMRNSGLIPTSSPTRMPIVLPSADVSSLTLESIRSSGVLRFGFYDVTVPGDNSDVGFSFDLVR